MTRMTGKKETQYDIDLIPLKKGEIIWSAYSKNGRESVCDLEQSTERRRQRKKESRNHARGLNGDFYS